MSAACGIDFGTSNSAVALSEAGRARLVALEGGATSVPTALFYAFDDDSVVHGREAMRRYLVGDDGRLLRSIKSVLGTSLWGETTQIKYKRYQFADIVTSFLQFLRAATEGGNSGGVEQVVIGRPAFFVDDDPEADARAQDQLAHAARAAGFRNVIFQLEPIAAALHYESSVAREEIALVADIGGGTSDFSLVRVSPSAARKADRRSDILGSNGVHIGGTDFDRLLSMASLMPHLGLRSRLKMKGMNAPSWYFSDLATWHRINFLYDAKVVAEIRSVLRDSAEPEKIERLLRVVEMRKGHELLNRIESAKIDLSDAEEATVPLTAIAKGLAMKIRRARLEAAIAESISRIEACISDLLRHAGLAACDVSTVFLTGGSSGVPAVREAILGAMPGAKAVAGDAFGSVASGLALDAERRFGPSVRRRKATASR